MCPRNFNKRRHTKEINGKENINYKLVKCAEGRPKRPVESILSNNNSIDLFNKNYINVSLYVLQTDPIEAV